MKFLNYLLISSFLFSLTALADTYQFDSSKSSAVFRVKKLAKFTVTGKFQVFSGAINYDPNNITSESVQAAFKTGSLITKDNMAGTPNFGEGLAKFRDPHLKSEDFFFSEKYPLMTFISHGVSRADSEHFTISGDLAIRDRTKGVEIVVTKINDVQSANTIHFRGTTEVDRQDFGMVWNRLVEGITFVDDKVQIELDIFGEKQ
jgi:polyisoprenoid-binding protein YceI